MAGLRVGQAYGVFHRPGFGLLVSVSPQILEHPTSICDTGVINFVTCIKTRIRNLAIYFICILWS